MVIAKNKSLSTFLIVRKFWIRVEIYASVFESILIFFWKSNFPEMIITNHNFNINRNDTQSTHPFDSNESEWDQLFWNLRSKIEIGMSWYDQENVKRPNRSILSVYRDIVRFMFRPIIIIIIKCSNRAS